MVLAFLVLEDTGGYSDFQVVQGITHTVLESYSCKVEYIVLSENLFSVFLNICRFHTPPPSWIAEQNSL